MQFTTTHGAPLSMPLAAIATAAASQGFALKPLAYGVRIMGTDVVLSDHWRGLYLCKSSGRGLARVEAAGVMTAPADKGQWRCYVSTLARTPDEAERQAHALCAAAVAAGYIGLAGMRDALAAVLAERASVASDASDASDGDASDKPSGDAAAALDALDALDAD